MSDLALLTAASATSPMILCEADVYDPETFLFPAYTPGADLTGFTVARASTARYLDANGVWQSASSGVLRDAHYIDGVRTTLLEPAATNLVWSCRDLRNATGKWLTGSVSFNQTGIDGVANACSLLGATSTASSLTSASVSGVYTMSAFLKLSSGAGTVTMRISGQFGADELVVSSSELSTTEFRRFSFSATITTANAYIVTSGVAVIVDCVQIEAGPVATTPIFTTTGATASRAADRLTYAPAFAPQAMTIVVQFIELGASLLTSLNAGIFSLGESTNEAIYIANGGAGPYRVTHKRASDVTSTATETPALNDDVSLRIVVAKDGSVLIGQSINGADETFGSWSSANRFSSAFSSAVLTIGDRGSGTGGPVAIRSVSIAPALTRLYFGSEREFVPKTCDLPNENLLTNSSDLNSAGWTHGSNAPTNGAATVGDVSLSRISNVGTPNAVSTTSAIPFSKIATKRCSFRIMHDGHTGQDLHLLYDSTGGVTLARVDSTFNSDGTITFTKTTGTRMDVYPVIGTPGAYDVFVESIAFTATHLSHACIFFASDASGASLGAGAVASFLIGGIRIEDEIPAQINYRGRLENPGTLSIDALQAWSQGLALFGLGEISVSNPDDAFDDFRRCVFDGYPITMYLGTIDRNNRLTRTLLYSGIMEQPDLDRTRIHIALRSSMYGLDRPILSATFRGTGASALDGDANIAGQIKPRVYGWTANFKPTIVDSGNLVYFVSDRACYLASAYDSGLALTYDAGPGTHGEYTTVSALIAASLPTGHWSYAIEGGVTYIRVKTKPTGEFTIFGCSYASTSDSTLEAIISQLLSDAMVTPTTVVCDGSYPVSPAGSYPVTNLAGVYGLTLTDNTTYANAIAALLGGTAWMWLNPVSNVWVIGQLPATTTGEAVQCTISDDELLTMTRLGAPKTPGEGIPPWAVNVNYDKLQTVQPSGLAATVSASWTARVARETLSRSATKASVKVVYPLAMSIDVNAGSLSDGVADPSSDPVAQLLADQYLDTLNQGWEFFQLTVPLTAKLLRAYPAPAGGSYAWVPATMPSFRGAVLGIRTSRFGFASSGVGTHCHVMSAELDLRQNQVSFIVATRFEEG